MEDKTRKDQLQAVWFAAGTAVLISCVERAVVVSIFKQWHMWVFLALNLLLIAILFTSTHPPRNCSNPAVISNSGQETGKKQPPGEVADRHEDAGEDGGNVLNLESEVIKDRYFVDVEEADNNNNDDNDGDDDDDDDGRSSNLLSNEELNERVEAFISKFRQQYLVSDVKIRRTSSDSVCGRAVFLKTVTV